MGEVTDGDVSFEDKEISPNTKREGRGKALSMLGILAAAGLTAAIALSPGNRPIPSLPKPATYVLPSRDAVESTLRESKMQAGHVVQRGETYASMGQELYGSKKAGKRLKSINEYMGNLTTKRVAVVTDSVDGKTMRDFAWKTQKVEIAEYSILGTGDTLFTPKYLTGFDGRSYRYSKEVSDKAVDSAYTSIKANAIDSLETSNVIFMPSNEDSPSGRRYNGEIGSKF